MDYGRNAVTVSGLCPATKETDAVLPALDPAIHGRQLHAGPLSVAAADYWPLTRPLCAERFRASSPHR